MSINHWIKIEWHKFPLEWVAPEPKYAPQVPYYPGKPGGGGYQPGQQPSIPPPGGSHQPPPQKKLRSRTTGSLQSGTTNVILR